MRIQKINKTKLELCKLENCIIPIPPRRVQKDIIGKSQSNMYDNEKIKALLENLNALFLETINDNISKIEKIVKEVSTENNLLPENTHIPSNSNYHYYGSKWVSRYYKKNGFYVQGHYRKFISKYNDYYKNRFTETTP